MMKKWLVKTLIATTLASAPATAPVDGTVGAYAGEDAIVSEVQYTEKDSDIVGQIEGRESASEEVEISLDF